MQRAPSAVLTAVLLLPLAACAGDSGPDTSGTLRTDIDTVGGVVQATNAGAAPAWSLERVVAFGGVGGGGEPRPDEFGAINALVADADGRVYVAEPQSREVRVFDQDGRHLHSFGRRGAGPGEFASVQSLAWKADTLFVLDPGNARMQRFTRDGAEAGVVHWMSLTGPVEWVRFFPTGDGLLHVRGVPPRGVAGFAFVAWDGARAVDSVLVRSPADPPPAAVTCHRPDDVISFFTIPHTPRALAVPAGDGVAAYAWSGDYRISFVNGAGDTVRRIVRDAPAPRVLDEEWSIAADSFAAFQGRMPAGSSCEPASIRRPATKPAVRALHFTEEGRLVVEAETEEGAVLDFYDDDGRLLGTVRAPERDPRVPPYFRDDRVYIVTRDPEYGVQGVAVYRIAR
jgi:hypothetical protein